MGQINATVTAALGSKAALGLVIPNKQAGANATISIGAGAMLGLNPKQNNKHNGMSQLDLI